MLLEVMVLYLGYGLMMIVVKEKVGNLYVWL